MRIAFTYGIFACLATAANIGAQELALSLYAGRFDVLASVIAGTGVGLVVKYVLDKRYIFAFRARDARHDGRTFMLYTATGLSTTLVFWGFEFGFDHLFESKGMRYLGAVIGLSLGYFAKYHLDKRHAFRTEPV